jgi:tRNA (mo5U34)-methyltransferase
MSMSMDPTELRSRIEGLGRWHYQFEFESGITTPIWKADRINRHAERSRYFFDRLLQVTCGSLRGRRVLDLGCNSGFWSLKAIEAGAEFVLGIDGRQMHVDQANFVFEAKGIDPARYRFELGNVLSHPVSGDFDVAFCLGLLYHVSKPTELFEVMAGSGADILVIDTKVSNLPGSCFAIRHEDLDDPRHAVDHELIFVPTRQAISALADQFGYRTAPLALDMRNTEGMKAYEMGRRVAFICARQADLGALPRESPPLEAQPGLRADALRLARSSTRTIHRRLRRLLPR